MSETTKRSAILAAAILALAGPAMAAEVNVYSARHYDTDAALYDGFTQETGITVNLIEAGADELIERIRAEGANSPADVLLTVDAGRLWRAEEAGILQPIHSELLEETAQFFDLALIRKQRPHPFDHKLHAHLRPYLVDSCQRMIDDGFHRESVAWMLPFHLATTDILAIDGTPAEQRWAAQRQEDFLEERRFATPEMRDIRFAEMEQLSSEIFALCWTMIERNPAIRQLELVR